MKALPIFAALSLTLLPTALMAQSPAPASDPHAGHPIDAEPTPPPAPDTAIDPHAGHDMSLASGDQDMPGGNAPAPAPPEDHAADAIFDPGEMAAARQILRQENGGFRGSVVTMDLAEVQVRSGREGYRWGGEAWFGGDMDRLLIKSEGEGAFGEAIETLEIQALYSRAITPFWNIHGGVRHDVVPNPSRTYAVAGIEGVAPYWLHLTGQIFLSDKGDVHARLEGSYDERITQNLILQPRVEVNLAAQDVSSIGVGSGLADFEIGARLRYEIVREFAPYIGVEWSRKMGDSARYARLSGGDPDMVSFVAGIRFWF